MLQQKRLYDKHNKEESIDINPKFNLYENNRVGKILINWWLISPRTSPSQKR